MGSMKKVRMDDKEKIKLNNKVDIKMVKVADISDTFNKFYKIVGRIPCLYN